jgi:hypothetical protein
MPRDRMAESPSAPVLRARFVIALAGVSLLCGLLLYARTLTASYAYDDMDHLNAAADVLANRGEYWKFVFRPHLEHLVPVVRMAFHASARLFGTWAFPFRLTILLAHLASAFFLSLTARRYSKTDAAGFAAALAYLVPCGFSSMWVWLPTGAGVPFGLIGITGGMAALANRSRLGERNARFLAGAGALFALLCENTLAPLLACPVLLDESERRQGGKVRGFSNLTRFALAAVVLWSLLSSALYLHQTGERFSFNLRRGVPRAAFLILVAPFRYFFPGLPLSRPGQPPRDAAILGSLLGLVVAGLAGALLLASSQRKLPALVRIAALSAVGPLGFVGLAGLRRWSYVYEELYDADRYFFALLIPASLFVAFAADRIRTAAEDWPRSRRVGVAVLLAGAVTAEFFAHRYALLHRFPRAVFDAHERRFAQLRLLASRLNEAARRLPPGHPTLFFPDSSLWFPDVHNGRLSARFLLSVADQSRPRELQLGGRTVGPEDARLLNPVLAAWAGDVGEPSPYFTIESGALVNARERGMADFRRSAGDESVVAGFYAWEGTSRWMGKRGELLLVMSSPRLVFLLASPMNAIRRSHPDWTSLNVRVTLIDDATGYVSPAGVVHVTEDGMQTYYLDAPDLLRRLGNARRVHLIMECEQSWRPIEVLPGSPDTRELTVQVFEAGFESANRSSSSDPADRGSAAETSLAQAHVGIVR